MKSRIAATLGAILILTTTAAAAAADFAGTRSRYADLVLDEIRPALPAGGPATARWAFQAPRQVLYRLEQTELQIATQRLDGASRTFERESETSGTMIVLGGGPGRTGAVRVVDATAETTVRAGGKAESVSARVPVVETAGLTESGRLEAATGALAPTSLDNLVAALFALPDAALAPGQTAAVPVRFGAAVQWGQSRERMETYPVIVEGVAKVTLAGRESVERCECLRFDIAFEVASTEPPRDFPGRFRIFVRGDARTWFDVRAARMAEGELAMILGIDLGAPERPDDAGMSILTDTHTRVRIGR